MKKIVCHPDGIDKEFIVDARIPYVKQDEKLPPAYIFDMDGTLSLMHNRNPFDYEKCDKDLPNVPVVEIMRRLIWTGATIVIVTARSEESYKKTRLWIKNAFKSFSNTENILLYMRKFGDSKPGHMVKVEAYYQHIKNKFNILGVFEDRNSAVKTWRDVGLCCFQVQEGDY